MIITKNYTIPKRVLSVLLVLVMLFLQSPVISAEGLGFSSSQSQITITETSEGQVVGQVINGQIVWNDGVVITPGKDYYFHFSLDRAEVKGKYFEIETPTYESDGQSKGVKFQNMPGQDGGFIAGEEVEGGAFSNVVYYEDVPKRNYGSSSNSYNVTDGKLIYKMVDDLEVVDTTPISVSFGFILDELLYNNTSSISDALKIKIGDYDESTNSVTPMAGYSITMNLDNVELRGSYTNRFGVSSANVFLDEEMLTPAYLVINNTCTKQNLRNFIYDTLEYDMYLPDGISLIDYGFSQAFSKVNSTFGGISCEQKETEGGKTRYHFKLTNGRTAEALNSYYSYFCSSDSSIKIGDNVQVEVKNISATLADGNILDLGDSTPFTMTICDPNADGTTVKGYNQTIYNSTIDTNREYSILLGRCTFRNALASQTPYDKIFEAEYNVKNADAVINQIIVPKGTNETPTIEVTGEDENGIVFTYVIPEPNKDIITSSSTVESSKKYDYGYLITASECGMVNIKSVKANIGCLTPLYNTTEPWSAYPRYNTNFMSCYGYFINDSVGIQVASNFRMYNENPRYRTKSNGDLSATSVFTSTDVKIIPINGNEMYVQNVTRDPSGKSVVKVSTSYTGNTAPAIEPGETVRLYGKIRFDSTLFASTSKDGAKATVQYLPDPVFYVILPNDFNLDGLSFDVQEKMLDYNTGEHTESKYYNKTSWKTVQSSVPYTMKNITYVNTTGDGNSIYKITFDDDIDFAQYSENKMERCFYYRITIKTSKSSATKRYPLSNILQFSSENPLTSAKYSGSLADTYPVADKYGLNGGYDLSGVTGGLDTIGEAWGFSLQKVSEVISNNAIIATKINGKEQEIKEENWHTYNENDVNSIVSLGAKSEGQFRLEIENTDLNNATKELQTVIPIPKQGVNLGTAFMENPMQFSMDMTWEASQVPSGVTVKYIKLKSTSRESVVSGFDYEECDKQEANAILVEKDSLGAGESINLNLSYVIDEDADVGEMDIFYNAIRYKSHLNIIEGSVGAKVAVDIAEGEINGKAFYDINRNGIIDEGEAPVAGVEVTVVDSFGKFSRTLTDKNGNYDFQAIRETDGEITFKLSDGSVYRMTIPFNGFKASNDLMSGTVGYKSLTKLTQNLPLDKYITLSYNANSPSGKTVTGDLPKSSDYFAGAQATVSKKPDNLSIAGYTFKNWNTKADGTGTSYDANETFTITEDTVLYAIWEYEQLYITFDYQGGSIATLNKELVKKKSSTILNYPTENIDSELITIPYQISTYLRDNIQKYFFTTTNPRLYMLPPLSMDNTSYLFGDSTYYNYLLTTKNGYEAVATNQNNLPWYKKNADGSKKYISYATAFTESTTLYLDWTPKTGYSVTYNTDGGNTIAPSTDLNWESNVYNLARTKVPVKKGWDFAYWTFNGEQIAKGTEYGDLAVEDTVMSIELKAIYTEKDYTVKYDSMGGTKVSSRTVKFNQTNMNSTESTTKTGFVFAGWSTDGTEENIIRDTQSYGNLVNDDLDMLETTLYAVWKEKTGYTVTFNTNGGTAVAEKTGLPFNANNLLDNTATTRVGCTFVNWTYGDDKRIVSNTDLYSELVNGVDTIKTIQLDANWEEIDYTIKYTNVQTLIEPLTPKHIDDNNLLREETPSWQFRKFLGWTYNGKSVDQTTKLLELIPNGVAENNTITLTANWADIKYTVEYDSAGGSNVAPLIDKPHDTKNLAISTPTRAGYTFDGWYSEKYADTAVTNDNTIDELLKNDTDTVLKLTAHWTPKSGFTVEYNLNGGKAYDGSDTINSISVKWNDKNLIPVNNPIRNGYSFVGWTYGTKNVDMETTYDVLAVEESVTKITLVAVWTPKNDFTVKYNLDGGKAYDGSEGIPDKTGIAWTDSNLIPSNDPVKDGYDFVGWKYNNSKDVYVTTTYNSLAETENNKTITIDAIWKQSIVKADIIFHDNKHSYLSGESQQDIYRRFSNYDTTAISFTIGEPLYDSQSRYYELPEYDNNLLIFKGWYYDKSPTNDEHPINWSTVTSGLKSGDEVHIYAHWIKIGTVKQENDGKVIAGGEYIEYDLAGVQIRDAELDPDHQTEGNFSETGLRFVTSLSQSVYDQIHTLNSNNASNFEYGYLLTSTAKFEKSISDANADVLYNGVANGIDTSNSAVKNVVSSTAPHDHFRGTGYRLYTVVVTYNGLEGDKLQKAHDSDLLARSYMRYTDANGLIDRVHYNSYIGRSRKHKGCSINFTAVSEMAKNSAG